MSVNVRYHQIEVTEFVAPFGWNHMFRINAEFYNRVVGPYRSPHEKELYAWFEERFGPDDDTQEYWINGSRILFKREDWALEFKIRWC